jgi:hypothetical protein
MIPEVDQKYLSLYGPGRVVMKSCRLCGFAEHSITLRGQADSVCWEESMDPHECPRCFKMQIHFSMVFEWMTGVLARHAEVLFKVKEDLEDRINAGDGEDES